MFGYTQIIHKEFKMAKQTHQIRILKEGVFHKLVEKVREQFKGKHGFDPTTEQVCESIGKAVVDHKIFG